VIYGKREILYLFIAALFSTGFLFSSYAAAPQEEGHTAAVVAVNQEEEAAGNEAENQPETQTQDVAAEEAASAAAEATRQATARGVRYGIHLPPRGADTSAETSTRRERRQIEQRVRFGMHLEPIERTAEDEEDDGVIRRVLDINSAADRAIMAFRDSVFAPPPTPEDTVLDFAHLTVLVDGRIAGDIRDSIAGSRIPRMYGWLGTGYIHRPSSDTYRRPRPNVGFGLLFPLWRYFGIRGEFSYMNTEFADSVRGYTVRGHSVADTTFMKCVLDTAAAFTVPVLANFMVRPGVFMFDMYAGASFFGNKEMVNLTMGSAIGRRLGRNGYLFGDARFGFGYGERFRSFGIGYEYVAAFARYEGGRRQHAIVAPADTFTISLKVNDERGGLISPRGEQRIRSNHTFGFAAMANYRWTLDSLIVNDTIMTGEIGTHTFNRIRNDMQILAMFTAPPETFNINILVLDPESGDTILRQNFTVLAGEDKEINITPQTGYVLSNLIINETSIGARNRYTIRNIDRDVDVKATFSYVRPVVIKAEATVQDGINFDVGTAELTEDSRRTLAGIHYTMVDNPEMIVEIMGHTDNTGGRQFNLTLSQARAQAVVDYLVEMGIDSNRLVATGFGPDRPIASNATPQGRGLNRRVEIRSIRRTEGGN
jgi:outer membrane protein OmpA-like peptidoglycan-associated protein